MASPYQAYRDQVTSDWSRIDMLIALFDKAIEVLDKLLLARDDNDEIQYQQQTLFFMQVMLHFRTGLNPEYGELPSQMLRLYEYIEHSVATRDTEQLQSARTILSDLRDSYNSIRDKATELEKHGEIPSLSHQQLCDKTA